ncbi:hypothetical protein [Oricola sp.]|uniref:hypothetical protein n=1 Tax=Oricola sp. TaxID=1979950 RepID=UPI0025D1DAE6|nr:hypothetical protein [Oricola sp.]MCI5076220.1 hypothetical protein [Oricola sp.]
MKIGTTGREVGRYRYEPFGTTEPIPCRVEFSVHVPDRHEVEKNLVMKLAGSRFAQDKSRFAVNADDAISLLIQLVGYDYTNAQITGVIFRKQVEMLKKMESDFRNRHKSFTIMNGELGDLQKQVRGYQREIGDKNAAMERQDSQLHGLNRQIDELERKARLTRLFAFVALGAAIVAGGYALVTAGLPF